MTTMDKPNLFSKENYFIREDYRLLKRKMENLITATSLPLNYICRKLNLSKLHGKQ
jgi:hypothetical protein